MPTSATPAESTALPQPPKTSQKVPRNSAPSRWAVVGPFMGLLLVSGRHDREGWVGGVGEPDDRLDRARVALELEPVDPGPSEQPEELALGEADVEVGRLGTLGGMMDEHPVAQLHPVGLVGV